MAETKQDNSELKALLEVILQEKIEARQAREAQQAKEADALAKRKREKEEMIRGAEVARAGDKAKQNRCPHQHPQTQLSAIRPVHNFPDGQVRGLCMECRKLIQPDHFEINAQGEQVLVKADREYQTVLQIEEKVNGTFTY